MYLSPIFYAMLRKTLITIFEQTVLAAVIKQLAKHKEKK